MENPLQIVQTFKIIECVTMKINDDQTLSLIVAVLWVVHSKTLIWAKPKFMGVP
jgi:hypothetical protein